MIAKYVFLFLFLTISIFGQKNSETITLIFKKSNYLFEETNGPKLMNPSISYTEFNSYETVYLSPANKKGNDTIHIELKSNKIFLIHNWSAINKSSRLILEKGDIVEIDYEKGFPFFKITNRITKRLDVNLESELNLSFPIADYQFYLNNKRSRTSKEEKEYNAILKNYASDFANKLNPLVEKDEISKKTFDNQASYVKYYFLNTDKETDFSKYKNDLKNEDLIWLKSYRYFLELYVKNEFKSNKTRTGDVELDPNDDENTFLKIEKSDLFSARAKEYLLYIYLNKLSTSQKLTHYISIFKKHSTNNKLIEGFESSFLAAHELLKKVAEEVVLFDENKQQTTLSELLKANNGKVIYIDFWASWCAPCRASFPDSKKLKKEFDEVIFLYLSIDTNFESWKAAHKKEELSPNSYFILNTKTADYLKKLAIDSIPRYLLLDQNGTIVNQNAYGPSSDKTPIALKKLLKSN